MADTEAKCDFCGSHLPEQAWAYPSEDFEQDIMSATESGETHVISSTNFGAWFACDPCHQGIQNEDWDALGNRLVETYLAANPVEDKTTEKVLTDHLLTVAFLVHNAFREHRSGDPYRQRTPH